MTLGKMEAELRSAVTAAAAWALADVEMVGSFASEDFKEGVAHFLEKRPAAFTGR